MRFLDYGRQTYRGMGWQNVQDETVSSGLYLARMESCGISKVVRMAMVK